MNREQRIYGRGDDFACVRTDPNNKDVVYVANTSTYRSTDGGRTFIAIKGAPGGKLAGSRVALKDNVCLAGVPMMVGADVLEGYVPDVDATIVTRILDAGGEIAGKAVCEYFCMSGGSHTSSTGPVQNPRKLGYTTGGWTAGPAVKRIISRLGPMLGVMPYAPDELKQLDAQLSLPFAPPRPSGAPVARTPDPDYAVSDFTEAQRKAADALRETVQQGGYSATLIDGVTGSGKTEVYFEAIAETVRHGRQALVLMPEIALTAQFLDRFAQRFGVRPAEWHSQRSPRLRARTWAAVAATSAVSVLVIDCTTIGAPPPTRLVV